MSDAARRLRFSVFGRPMLVTGRPGAWSLHIAGPDGKSRPAGVSIPADVTEAGLAGYLDDVFHECATPRHPAVLRLD